MRAQPPQFRVTDALHALITSDVHMQAGVTSLTDRPVSAAEVRV